MISHELRCIFVHIQKTGGSSVRQALNMAQQDPYKHRFATELRGRYGPEMWHDYFKFAFVRNPWERLVSWWEMIRRNAEGGRPTNGFQRFVIARARTFEDFIHKCDVDFDDIDGSKWIFRNQIDYLSDSNGDLLVDFVGRFERLPDDLVALRARLGLQAAAIPHLNRSNHPWYAQYYSPELSALVGARFARDIAAFGYTFERHRAAAPTSSALVS